jgi:hypothetical protein
VGLSVREIACDDWLYVSAVDMSRQALHNDEDIRKAYRGELFLLSAEKGRRVRVKETRAGGGRTDELLRVSISGGTADTAWDCSG